MSIPKRPSWLTRLPFTLLCVVMPRTTSAARVRVFLQVCECGACQQCWRFTGEHDDAGYGVVRGVFPHRSPRAHVAVWVQQRGPLPSGEAVIHRAHLGCHHRDCCRLDHLEATSAGDAPPGPRRGRRPPTERGTGPLRSATGRDGQGELISHGETFDA